MNTYIYLSYQLFSFYFQLLKNIPLFQDFPTSLNLHSKLPANKLKLLSICLQLFLNLSESSSLSSLSLSALWHRVHLRQVAVLPCRTSVASVKNLIKNALAELSTVVASAATCHLPLATCGTPTAAATSFPELAEAHSKVVGKQTCRYFPARHLIRR